MRIEESALVVVVAEILDVLGRQRVLLRPIIVHLGRVVESDTEELGEGVDVVGQAFLSVVFVSLTFRNALRQGQSIGLRQVIMVIACSIFSPISPRVKGAIEVTAAVCIAGLRSQIAKARIVVGVGFVDYGLGVVSFVVQVVLRH